MSMSNAALARRADLAIGQLQANGGYLLPQQSNQFIDFVLDEPTILKQVRQVRMASPQVNINRLGFGSRILVAGRNSTTDNSGPYDSEEDGGADATPRAVRKADRAAPTTTQIQLNSHEVTAEVRIPYEVLEDNIEGPSFESHVMRLIAQRVALDLEEWAINADTGSGDAYLALEDGYLVRMTSNVVDNLSAGISPDLFETGLLTMPQQYLRNLTALRHWITVQDEIRYRANVAKRATGYGDSSLTQNNELVAYGVPVEKAPLMPAATGFFTYPNNLIFGIQRDIMVETDKDITAREIIIVVSARVGVQIDDEPATVKYTNI
jgi:hypothetical protein